MRHVTISLRAFIFSFNLWYIQAGWQSIPGQSSKYQLFTEEITNDKAMMNCKGLQAHLVYMETEVEQNDIYKFISSGNPTYWIGLIRESPTRTNSPWMWSASLTAPIEGELMSYHSFESGENTQSGKDRTFVDQKIWKTEETSASKAYICELEDIRTTVPPRTTHLTTTRESTTVTDIEVTSTSEKQSTVEETTTSATTTTSQQLETTTEEAATTPLLPQTTTQPFSTTTTQPFPTTTTQPFPTTTTQPFPTTTTQPLPTTTKQVSTTTTLVTTTTQPLTTFREDITNKDNITIAAQESTTEKSATLPVDLWTETTSTQILADISKTSTKVIKRESTHSETLTTPALFLNPIETVVTTQIHLKPTTSRESDFHGTSVISTFRNTKTDESDKTVSVKTTTVSVLTSAIKMNSSPTEFNTQNDRGVDNETESDNTSEPSPNHKFDYFDINDLRDAAGVDSPMFTKSDQRVSSIVVGTLGIFILLGVLAFLLLLDFSTIHRDLAMLKRNLNCDSAGADSDDDDNNEQQQQRNCNISSSSRTNLTNLRHHNSYV